jgi:ankyrin repeat protein
MKDDQLFVPVIFKASDEKSSLFRITFDDNHDKIWDIMVAGQDANKELYNTSNSRIITNFTAYFGAYCKTVLLTPYKHKKEHDDLEVTDAMSSTLLGIFLAAAHKLRGWKFKDDWDSVTVTGTFKKPQNEADRDLLLDSVEDVPDKYNGQLQNYADVQRNEKHLFLYVRDQPVEGLAKKENIVIKTFSPDDTVFDVLDYVFELPCFLETIDTEQKKLIDKFADETQFADPINGCYIKPGDYLPLRNSLRKEKPGRGFFFHGTGGGGKTVMSIQIARDMLWNNKIYAPIMIKVDPREIMDAFAGKSMMKVQDYLLQKLAEYLEKAPGDIDLSRHQKYLIIIDNLDLSESSIKELLRRSNDFFERFSNCIFIFTSRTKIKSQRLKGLDLTASAMLPFSSKEETEEFFINASINEDYYKTKVKPMMGTREYSNFIDELHDKMKHVPYMIAVYCRSELSSIGVDLVYLTGELKKNELSGDTQGLITEVYAGAFEKLGEDAKALLFMMCAHGIVHRWTLDDLEDWARKRIHRWKYDMTKLRPSIEELDYYRFIHEEVSSGKSRFYILPITYTTIYFEKPFSNKGMREKIIGPYFMLVESLFYNGSKETVEDCLTSMESYGELPGLVLDSRGHDMFEENKNPLLLAASYHDDPAAIESIWKRHPEWYRPDDIGMTPLHYAALYSNSKAVMDKLLEINWNYLNNKDFGIATYDNGFNVVHMAAQNGQHEIIQTLLDYITTHVMNYLIEQLTNRYNNTPLHIAAGINTNPRVVEALLRCGADLNRINEAGYTPLAVAAQDNSEPEVIETLVRFGADINHKNQHNQTPLILAILGNPNDSICKKLLSYNGVDIDALTDQGQSALLLAADLNKVDCVKMLLDHGANPNMMNKDGITPLNIAVGMNNYDIVKLLLQYNKGVDK